MIGQHIFSRCLEGYFSRSSINADSTTVTISVDMFAQEKQAKLVAKECEKISTLEDARTVPENLRGAYRGVLKIRRLNQQITMICRSYRLHSQNSQDGGSYSGSGEFRDFTYSTSYLLAGEDKTKFLNHPEYFLNIQDFEPYPSVMERIEQSRASGHNGRIEVNRKYSLFNSPCRNASMEVFQQAGFDHKLFVDYISSVIQRVSLQRYSGHERDKVLVILPRRFNALWKDSGGNGYAEEVLAATMKLLPNCVSSQLNAFVGGLQDPDSNILRGYQLVFMEPGSTKDWKRSEYSVIDLERQESYVSRDLSTAYGEFLWQHLSDAGARAELEEQYEDLFGADRTEAWDNSPRKFEFLMEVLSEEQSLFGDKEKRGRLLAELLYHCGETWTDRGIQIGQRMLELEDRDSSHNSELEKQILNLAGKDTCPQEFKTHLVTWLLNEIAYDNAEPESVQWLVFAIQDKNPLVEEAASAFDQQILADTSEEWYKKKSLLDFYLLICRNKEIRPENRIKQEVTRILSNWYIRFLEKSDWENCALILQILSEQLEDPGLLEEGRRGIYQDLIYLLFFGEGEGRKQAVNLLKSEERKIAADPKRARLLWECFKEQLSSDDVTSLNEDVIWQMAYFALMFDREFLAGDWNRLYIQIVQRFGVSQRDDLFRKIKENFTGWTNNIKSTEKQTQLARAVYLSEKANLEYSHSVYLPSMQEMRESTFRLLEQFQMKKYVSKLLYARYCAEPLAGKNDFLLKSLKKEEAWKVIIIWKVYHKGEPDGYLESVFPRFYSIRDGFFPAAAGFTWNKSEEIHKLADLYFSLVETYVGQKKRNEAPLAAWCHTCQEELPKIQAAELPSEFQELCHQKFRKKLVQSDPEHIGELTLEDIRYLSEAGFLPLGEDWKALDLLQEVSRMDSHVTSEEFLSTREKIIRESNPDVQDACWNVVEGKRKELEQEQQKEELIYNLVLLEEQHRQIHSREPRFSLRQMTEKVWGKATGHEELLTALNLLYVISCYRLQTEEGAYDCNPIGNYLMDQVVLFAEEDVELFENKQVFQAYKRLGREYRSYLRQEKGLGRHLKDLSGEWQQNYGIQKQRAEWGLREIFFLAAVILVGITVEILYFLLFDKIAPSIAMIAGIALLAAGAIGNVVSLIYMHRTEDKTKTSLLLGVFSVLMATGFLLIAQYPVRWYIRSVHAKEKVKEYKEELEDLEEELQGISDEALRSELAELGVNADAVLDGTWESSVTGDSAEGLTGSGDEDPADAKGSSDETEELPPEDAEGPSELEKELSALMDTLEGDWAVCVKVIGSDSIQIHSHSHAANGMEALFAFSAEEESEESFNQTAKELGYADTRKEAGNFYTSVADCVKRMDELRVSGSLPAQSAEHIYADEEDNCQGITVQGETSMDEAAFIQAAEGLDYIICISGEKLTDPEAGKEAVRKISESVYEKFGK